MNVIFVEPAFPAYQRQFVRGLHAVGATVIGIGERPGDWLDDELKGWMHHYHQIGSVTDVRALHDAVRWIQDKVWVDGWRRRSRRTSCPPPRCARHVAFRAPAGVRPGCAETSRP